MQTKNRIIVFKTVVQVAGLLLSGALGVFGQAQQVNLSAGPANTVLPDGTSVPMWGYSCGTAVTSSTATCAALNKSAGGNWSPVVITVPTGSDLTINLTNNLSFTPGGSSTANAIPTSLVIVGQLGGGLGGQPTTTPSPNHPVLTPTWPIATTGPPTFTPPMQQARVQSFGTEVAAGATTALTWKAPRAGTYLLESGTHPSIQGPMGLYGIVVVTNPSVAANAATSTAAAAGTAYPGVSYDADVPLLLSEIDPVQNNAVSTAVNKAGFSETAVWSGQPGGCGNPTSATYQTCYPPAVNYTPLYYLFNGVGFNKTNASASLFAASTPIATPPASGSATGQVLVRFVNAGVRMHVPSIVGSQTTVTSTAGSKTSTGFSLIAEDGNPLPGVPRVQSEVFMAAGKTYDVMINAPAANAAAVPVFDRELSLSGNATQRDAGMLAYLSINGSALPSVASLGGAVANPDMYPSVVPGNTLTVSDTSKGVIANDVNVYGVQVKTPPTHGALTLAANGTFTYAPDSSWSAATSATTTDTFTYQANGNAAITALVTLSSAPIENANGITVNPITFTSTMATYLAIKTPGVLAVDKDAKGYPLTVAVSSVKPGSGLTVTADKNGGFNASVTSPGTYTFTYQAQNSQGTLSSTATVTVIFPQPSNLAVNVVDGYDKTTPITDYRWIIEEDRTFYVNPNCTTNSTTPIAGCPTASSGTTVPPTFGVNFAVSSMPFVAQGCTGPLSCESGQTLLGQPAVCDVGNGLCRTTGSQQTAVLPSQVYLDPTKRYYISVLPGDAGTPFATGNMSSNCTNGSSAPGASNCGHSMGGAPISFGQLAVTVLAQPDPFPPGKLSVFVFEDDFPLNGEQDAGGGVDVLAPLEPGLGGFQIHLWDAMGGNGDFTGQMTYDMFNQPLTNSLAGSIDPATGKDACPIAVQTGGITGMIVTCPKYESDGVSLSPLAGQAIINNLMPGRWGVVATPGADRIARGEEWLQTNTLDGQKAHDVFTRIGEPEYFQEYGPASYHVTIGFANPAIINGRKAAEVTGAKAAGLNVSNSITGTVTTERMSRTPDERLYSSGSHDSFYFSQCYVSFGDPDGEDFAFTKCDSNGKFTLTGLPDGNWRVTVFDQWNDALVDGLSTPVALSGGKQVNMGDIATNQWQANLYTRTFIDDNKDGVSQSNESGIPLIPVSIRLRDGSLENNLVTDFTGTANFNETFPLFNWYVVETDNTRYKTTGTHVVYDSGGPADGSASCGQPGYPACGTSTIGKYLANTAEPIPVPSNLRVPGAVYCGGADCTGLSIAAGPEAGGSSGPGGSTGRIDPPWVVAEGFQGFSGENNFMEFGKTPYIPGENGGIQGHVVYASTRPFDDPQLLVQAQWEPLVPHVTINLYQEGTAPDGSQSLTLVDTTQTSSFDDWAQGFRSDGMPNMNCPGQSTADLFYFTLYNQPNYLNVYNAAHGGPAAPSLPNNSQYKCYDGLHSFNQIQPAPYDGMYKFPSVTGLDPVSGKPTGTNCTICTKDPDANDPYRSGTPMLPVGKYVVEVVVPAGYELVKEEDKNILIGDNFIAPVTQEFPNLATAVFILPDQASIASAYNANNAQNPTQSLGNVPLNQGVPAYPVEPVWACVGESRIVPDFISLFPGSKEVSPFAGATRNLCDRKEVTLGDQMGTTAKFYIFTSTHIASKFTGVITDDFTSEFDPFSPQFGEKFSPPNMPISIKDWTGAEISRVYSDQWGDYNGLQYSTWEVNPPNPTGYSPTMSIFCMNDPGTGPTPDPLFNPAYSQFCYELPFMPGTTQYLDTPVVPTSAFSEGYNHPDCAYPALTPAISEVDGDSVGPWVKTAGAGSIGTVTVTNGGSGYTSAPNVSFSAPPAGGTTATGTATLGGSGAVGSVTVSASGSGYTSAPAVTFSAPPAGGTAATGTSLISGKVTGVTITNGGSGYCLGALVTFSAPSAGGAAATGLATVSNRCGPVTGVTILTPGSGYTSAPTVNFSAFFGSGAKGTAAINEGVTGLTLTNPGSGYTSAPTVGFTGGGGSGAVATAALSSVVKTVNIVNAGSGYTTAPTVTFSNGGGSGAAATAALSSGGTLTINALGDLPVVNNGYSGPQATTAPFNQKTVTRHYGFGAAMGGVTIGGKTAPVNSWSDTKITVTVPGGVPNCAVQQQAQYGGSTAQCGQLVVTTASGVQSIDTVTVTIGGKAPTLVSGTIQGAIDAAAPGDLLIVPAGVHNELVLMWKPVRLQGVGAASSIINANTHPAGKLDPWRAQVNCLFGLALNGQPYTAAGGKNPYNASTAAGAFACPGNMAYFTGGPNNPQVDRLPLEGILGWDTTVNGNLAQLLQEPTLLGAYEGAGITVLSKGVNIPPGSANIFGSGAESAFPAGSTVLTAANCATGPSASNLYSSNFLCNPSSIDGLSVTDSSQGGGGIFVHAWAHDLQIANNRVYNNIGTLSGGINIGQGESPDAYLAGDAAGVDVPTSCMSGAGLNPNKQLPYCFDLNVNVHNNAVTLNTSIGDELFSGSPAGAGGVTFCTGADYYKFDYNWVCGNMGTGDGGGFAHIGFVWNGDIEHNSFLFNQSLNPTISTNGGGLVIMGAPPDGYLTGTTTECGGTVLDADCTPGLSDGTGPGLVINGNLIMGNAAESGSGGGLRLQDINGTEVALFPNANGSRGAVNWNAVTVTNNIIANNVAGWDGGGISLQDALAVNIINNTIISNDTTASAGVLFNTIGAPLASAPAPGPCATNPNAAGPCVTASTPQPAGLVAIQNSPQLTGSFAGVKITCPTNNPSCQSFSNPYLANDVFWQNRAFYIGVGGLSAQYQQNIVTLYNAFSTSPAVTQPATDATTPNGNGLVVTGGTGACGPGASYWDIGVRGDTGPTNHTLGKLAPTYSVITDAGDYPNLNNLASNPNAISQYCNGSRTPPEYGGSGYNVPPGISDATVPNPIFNLTPTATVDEGNNWVNMTWGPLATTNPVTGATIGNYALANGSPAIDAIPTTAATYAIAPATDFFGNPRPDVGGSAIDIGAVEYRSTPPGLVSINPNSGVLGTTVAVTLTGTNLTPKATVAVAGGGVTVNTVKYVNATTLTANFVIATNAVIGGQTVSVTTPDGTSNTVPFTVARPAPPTLTGINPATGVRGTSNIAVTLTGTTLTGATAINVPAGFTVTNLTVVSATSITATFAIGNTASTGPQNISVTTPGGTSGNVSFMVTAPPAPTLTGINPNTGLRGTTVSVTLTGTNLMGATVAVSGTGVTATTTAVSATSVTANFVIAANAATGGRTVTITNGGGTTNTEPFNITAPPPPTLTSISPTSGGIGQTVTVTLNGTNLSTATSVNINGNQINVVSFTVVSNTQVTAKLQIGMLAIFEPQRTISVTTAGGTTNTEAFTVN